MAPSRVAHKPNILLVTTDTQRTDTISSMGNPNAISPSIDRLCNEGVVFDEAYTCAPVCLPARTSLLTGVHTPVHGAIENSYDRRSHLVTFPDILERQGYTNIMVGKTHFGDIPDSFHVQHILKGKKAGKEDFYSEHLRRHGYEKVSEHPNPIPEHLFEPACLVDKTIESIESVRNAGKTPFFAFCSILSPHGPLDPPGRWASAYDHRPLPPLNYRVGEVAEHPSHLKTLLGLPDDRPKGPGFNEDGTPNMEAIDETRRLYYGLAAHCDDQIGRLFRYLDETGLRESTLVIFSSDHGVQLFDHGFKNKHNYYDESWRVPLVISMPGTIPQGERRDFAVWNDITATIVAAAGGEAPTMQGFDLFSPLSRGKDAPRSCAVGTLYRSCALATPRWKLEYYFEEASGRLFDRKEDPLEQADLWDDPKHRELRDDLARALLTWRSDLLDVQYSHEKIGGGGSVSKRVGALRRNMRGTDVERRLDDTVRGIEERFASL